MYGMEMTQRFVSLNQKFGKLKLRDDIKVTPGSHARVWWLCDCGKDVQQSIRYVTRGRSTDCRRCNAFSQSIMASTKFGKLKLIDPVECLPASEKKLSWQCDCGKAAVIPVFNVLSGRTKTCGNCNTISKDELSSTRFGKLTMVEPEALKPNSNKKIRFLCDCGNETETVFKLVTSGMTKSCGMCNVIPASILATKKFGRLRLKESKVESYDSICVIFDQPFQPIKM